jgi:hypothetical protein
LNRVARERAERAKVPFNFANDYYTDQQWMTFLSRGRFGSMLSKNASRLSGLRDSLSLDWFSGGGGPLLVGKWATVVSFSIC